MPKVQKGLYVTIFRGEIVVILYSRTGDLARDCVKYLVAVSSIVRLILVISADACCKETLNYARTYVNLMVIFMENELLSCYIQLRQGISTLQFHVAFALGSNIVQNCYDISSLCSEKFDFVYLRTFPKMKDPFQTHC